MSNHRTILTLSLLWSSACLAASEPIALEEFVKPAEVEQLSLSPDGRYIATLAPRDDRTDLIVLDRATMQPTAHLTPPENQHVANYHWVTDNRLVSSLAIRLPGTEKLVVTGELWGIDADNKNNKYLFGYRGAAQIGSNIKRGGATNGSAFVLEPKADDKQRILVGIQNWQQNGEVPFLKLARLHVGSGALTTVGTAPVHYFSAALTDHDGLLRFISGSEADRQQKLFYREDGKGEWKLLNDQAQTGRIIEPLAFNRTGDQVYARIDDGKSPAYFARYNPQTGVEKVLLRDKLTSVGGVVLTADDRDVFALQTLEGRGGYAFLNGKAPEAELTRNALASFPGEQVIASSFSRDGQFATVFVYSDVNAGEYFLHDREQGKLTLLARRRPNLPAAKMASTEPFSMEARDGLALQGLITLPPGGKTNLPLVVLPHGGPYGIADRWGFSTELQILASRGYAVLQLDFRGSGGHGQNFEDAGVGEWGGKMQDDLTDATHWAIEQKIADPERICLYGTSYGGYAALMGVVSEPDLYRCAIGSAGVYDLQLMKTRGDVRKSALGRDFLDEIFDKDPQWLRQRSPALRADEIKAAVMLIHGGEDDRVPPVHAERMRQALIDADNAPEWIFESREGHGFIDRDNRLNMYQKILEFLDQQIGAGSRKTAD